MNRIKKAQEKLAGGFAIELTPLKVEVLTYILENGSCKANEAARVACGHLALDYLTKMQGHRLFNELEEQGLVACHRQYRQLIVEIPLYVRKELAAHIESYRLLKHSLLGARMADATATVIATKSLFEQSNKI